MADPWMEYGEFVRAYREGYGQTWRRAIKGQRSRHFSNTLLTAVVPRDALHLPQRARSSVRDSGTLFAAPHAGQRTSMARTSVIALPSGEDKRNGPGRTSPARVRRW